MTETTIRRADTSDADRLSLIGAATFLDSYAEILNGNDILAHCANEHGPDVYRQQLSTTRAAAWLAETEKTQAPVGYALVCEPDLPLEYDDSDLELKRIYILSRFHGSGLGASLLERAIAYARSLDAKNLLLGVYADNARAIGFYEHLGFRKVGTRQFQVGCNTYGDDILALRL